VQRKKQIEKTLSFYQEPELTAFKTKDQIRRLSTLAGVSAKRDSDQTWNIKNTFYSAILVDVAEDDMLSELVIDINMTAPAMTAMVVVERSEDLTTWTTVASPKKIIFVDNGVEKLRDGRIFVRRNVRGKYLRIAVLSNLKKVTKTIASVTAKYESIETTSPILQWQRAILQPIDEKRSEWVAILPSYLPISSMRMSPASDIVYYQGRLFSDRRLPLNSASQSLKQEGKQKLKRVIKQLVQPQTDAEKYSKDSSQQNFDQYFDRHYQWHYVSQFSQHFSQQPSQSLSEENTPASAAAMISFPTKNSRHWKLRFDQPASLNESRLPIVDFGWQADELVFLAQGEPPFTLLVGSEDEKNNDSRLHSVAFPVEVLRPTGQNQPVQPERVGIKQVPTADTIDSTKEIDAEKTPWSKILLWLVLVDGIFVMGFMVYKLMKKMKQKNNMKK
jgi:hypothetical protein